MTCCGRAYFSRIFLRHDLAVLDHAFGVEEFAHGPQISDRIHDEKPLRRDERKHFCRRTQDLLHIVFRLVDVHARRQLERNLHEIVRLEVVQLFFFDAADEARVDFLDFENAEVVVDSDRGEAASLQGTVDSIANLVERVGLGRS